MSVDDFLDAFMEEESDGVRSPLSVTDPEFNITRKGTQNAATLKRATLKKRSPKMMSPYLQSMISMVRVT